ncbi:MAG: endonuclease/exonuclease/phosphatase family protein [Myxococcota bacterium]
MHVQRRSLLPSLLLVIALSACAERASFQPDTVSEPDGRPDAFRPEVGDLGGPRGLGDTDVALVEVATPDVLTIELPPTDAALDFGPDLPQGPAPSFTVATWNLRKFSPFGVDESRLANIAAQLAALDADVIGLQEIEAREFTDGSPPQAWDALLDALPAYDGVHVPWNLQDSVVGLLVRRDTVRILAAKPLFVGDWWPFPRAPLDATLLIQKPEGSIVVHVVVVHLKAFGDSESFGRRREACQKLNAFLGGKADTRYILVGDFNDSVLDPPAENTFFGTLLDAEPTWTIATAALPESTVSSTSWFHVVDGQQVRGELIDHVIVDETITDVYPAPTAEVIARPLAEYDTWTDGWSDHFPVLLHLTP